MTFHILGVIIPTDELHHFSQGQVETTNQLFVCLFANCDPGFGTLLQVSHGFPQGGSPVVTIGFKINGDQWCPKPIGTIQESYRFQLIPIGFRKPGNPHTFQNMCFHMFGQWPLVDHCELTTTEAVLWTTWCVRRSRTEQLKLDKAWVADQFIIIYI